jgi:hypothetical protein
MVRRENKDFAAGHRRHRLTHARGEPTGEVFEAPERPGRLRELLLTGSRGGLRMRVNGRYFSGHFSASEWH